MANSKAGFDRKDNDNLGFETQGSNFGTKALHILYGDADKDADNKNLNKGGRSGRGNHPLYRQCVDNSKRRGRKAWTKKARRELARI
jgi:hypothetical protein